MRADYCIRKKITRNTTSNVKPMEYLTNKQRRILQYAGFGLFLLGAVWFWRQQGAVALIMILAGCLMAISGIEHQSGSAASLPPSSSSGRKTLALLIGGIVLLIFGGGFGFMVLAFSFAQPGDYLDYLIYAAGAAVLTGIYLIVLGAQQVIERATKGIFK